MTVRTKNDCSSTLTLVRFAEGTLGMVTSSALLWRVVSILSTDFYFRIDSSSSE